MPVDFEREHRAVLDMAHLAFVAKSKTRGQMWIDTTIQREIDMIREKVTRAEAALKAGLGSPDLMFEFEDSMIDLINFADFAVKKARRGDTA